jgi:hypothetical protein
MGKSPKKRAVIIGVNKYNDVNIPALDHAENDAQEIFDMLSVDFSNGNRKLFLGKAANYDAIKKEVESIFDVKDPDPYEVVVIYFSGHLYAKSEENSSWICPYDIDFQDPSLKGLRLGSELGEHFKGKAHVQKIILILDCCIIGNNSSEPLAYNWDNFKKDFDDRTNGKVTLIIHNAKTKDEKEPSFSKHNKNNRLHHHGVLSLCLIEELDKHNDLVDPLLYRTLESKMKDKGMILRCYNAYSVPSGNLPNHIERDQSTIKDLLGYEPYAKSICKFITAEETEAPLCISIQAPWGGGKTSIMKMVRKYLDPHSPDTISSNLHVKDKNSDKAAMKDLIKDLNKPEEIKLNDIPGMSLKHTRLTIWFNPWKYESTEQVWAGLADSIISEVAARLEKKGDLFLFRLHLSRVDPTVVRRTLYDRILKLWLHKSYPWLSISAIGVVFSILISALEPTISALIEDPAIKAQAPWLGITAGIILALSGSVKSALELRNVRDEPAQATVEEYVNVPDYRAKLGFIHHVEKDLTHIFDIIGKDKSKPLVVFVDDLDRCTPENVASVMEGVNLFLASEIPCIFIMGVDPAIVAASLEQRHKEIIASMPSYSKNIPIGWRFMDKFVQLPVLIPPAKKTFVDNYVEKLLLVENTKPIDLVQTENPSDSTKVAKPIDPQYQTVSYDVSKISPTVLFYVKKFFLLKHNFRRTRITKIETTKTMDTKSTAKDIETGESNDTPNNGSDGDKEFRHGIMKAIPEFSENPRDIKRFINLLRFHRYLNESMGNIAKQDSSIEYREASSQQLRDWIVLYLKWPEVIRWLYWNADANATRERLECLEEIVKTNSRDLTQCAKVAEMKLNLSSKDSPWISDTKLWEFLSKRKEHMRISNAMGRTVY